MARHRDRDLLRKMHLAWKTCALCGSVGWDDDGNRIGLSLHHIFDRDDVLANLVMLCGDGVAGCHGLITAEDDETRYALGAYLHAKRPDTIRYINEKLPNGRGWAWLERRLYLQP